MVKGTATYWILEDKKTIATRQSKPMEEISSSVAVPFTLGVGNLIQKESAVTTHMEITGLKLMANTAAAALMLNPAVECLKENQVGAAALVSEMVIECESNWVLNEGLNQARKEDELMLAVDFQCLHSSSSQSVANGKSDPCREEAALWKSSFSEIDSPIIIKVDDDVDGKSGISKLCPSTKLVEDTVCFAMDITNEDQSGSDESDPRPSAVLLDQLPGENKTWRTSNPNALKLNSGPLWGCSSICGMRQEMEDAISVRPQLFQVSSQMLINDHVNENGKQSLAHFFAVYDGHGGLQVWLKITLTKLYKLYC